MEKMIEEVNGVLVDEFEVERETIQPTADFRKTLDLDSLDYVDLVVAIDSVTGVKLVEKDFKSIANFEDFYGILHHKIQENTTD